MMFQERIFAHPLEVNARLGELNDLSRKELIEVAQAAVAARNEATDDDPVGTGGQLAYIYGTRQIRLMLRRHGWQIDRTENVEGTYHPESQLKIVYQNVDLAATRWHTPRAISGKGPGTARLVQSANRYLFSYMEEEEMIRIAEVNRRLGATIWFFCVSVREIDGEQEIRAELSCPSAVTNSQFSDFIDRIFILTGGDPNAPDPDVDDDDILEYEVDVSRKI